MQLQLVAELRGVAAHEHQLEGARVSDRGLGILHPQPLAKPVAVLDQVLEQEGERLGHRVVPQMPELERQAGVGVRVVLDVATLVEERAVVVPPARRRDHQIDLVGNARRRAEGAR